MSDYSMADFRAEMERRGVAQKHMHVRIRPRSQQRPAPPPPRVRVTREKKRPLLNLWNFRDTGRQAVVVRVTTSRLVDNVVFRFVNELGTRKVTTRRFLEDFVRAGSEG